MKSDHSPAMQQYLDIKSSNEDTILFFRMGDFYEMFFEDAKLASRLLGIALTSRDKGKKIPMCGFPHHAAKGYIARLINEGHKVALCEQMEDPASVKGIVKRAVTRVITPGVALEDEYLDEKKNNFIGALALGKKLSGFAYMDVLTGDFRVTEFNSKDAMEDELRRVGPQELIVEGETLPPANKTIKNISSLAVYDFSFKVANKRLVEHFGVKSLDGFGCAEMSEGVKAAGALLFYVKETQKAELSHIEKLSPYKLSNHLIIDHSTQKNLELTENLHGNGKEGTLLNLLDRTMTAMGGRELRQWITCPLIDKEIIEARLDGVSALFESRNSRMLLQDALDSVFDLERLIGRVSMAVANPRDMVALKNSLLAIPEIKEIAKKLEAPYLKALEEKLDTVKEASDIIETSINDEPPFSLKDGGVIKPGFNKELDELREIGSGGKSWIAKLEADERERTGNNLLKVGYNRVFGYYIEITKSKLDNIPEDYIRKQTLVNAERFITPALKEWEAKILTAEERAGALETALFNDIRDEVASFSARVHVTAKTVATLDALASIAEVSLNGNYIRPVITTDDKLKIIDGRHPVVEANIGSDEPFVPNDLEMDSSSRLHIITGPNMAGKSTFMRQTALITIMAQIGSFVPASSAEIGITDRIFTRVGASDDLNRGQSTFMVEMNETANILNNATPKSLVILDEIGRGTSTFDGLSIAWAVAEYLHDHPKRSAKTLFATHYHELTELTLTKERVKNYNMSVKEWDDKVIFLRKVVPGGASRSYGIQVARLAGLPRAVLSRAQEILANLEEGEVDNSGTPRPAGHTDNEAARGANDKAEAPFQPTLTNIFNDDQKLRDYLEELDLDETSPIDALKALFKMKEML